MGVPDHRLEMGGRAEDVAQGGRREAREDVGRGGRRVGGEDLLEAGDGGPFVATEMGEDARVVRLLGTRGEEAGVRDRLGRGRTGAGAWTIRARALVDRGPPLPLRDW